jgi:hypothetical protein
MDRTYYYAADKLVLKSRLRDTKMWQNSPVSDDTPNRLVLTVNKGIIELLYSRLSGCVY